MALITCRRCGKKISDSTECCIHCGESIVEEAPEEVRVEPETVVVEETAPTPEPRMAFSLLDEDTRDTLEAEFIHQSRWAKKYLRAKKESGKFISWGFIPLILTLVLGRVAGWILKAMQPDIVDRLMDMDVLHPWLERLSIAFLILYFVLFLGMVIYGIATKIWLLASHSRLVYMKKFGQWIEREKGISYEAPLVYENEKELYDSIILEEDL